jgi:hypothetical protein
LTCAKPGVDHALRWPAMVAGGAPPESSRSSACYRVKVRGAVSYERTTTRRHGGVMVDTRNCRAGAQSPPHTAIPMVAALLLVGLGAGCGHSGRTYHVSAHVQTHDAPAPDLRSQVDHMESTYSAENPETGLLEPEPAVATELDGELAQAPEDSDAPYVEGDASEVQPPALGDVDPQGFVEDLQPLGRWVATADYASCWVPTGVPAGWRPYTIGRWAYTTYGLTWVSDEPWGYITYHYGSWAEDPVFGWIWVPGRVWGPAWVAWQASDEYIGWAPLPPRLCFRARHRIRSVDVVIEPRHYYFVPAAHIVDRHVHEYIVPVAANATIIHDHHLVNVTDISVSNNRIINRSLSFSKVKAVTNNKTLIRERLTPVANRQEVLDKHLAQPIVYKPAAVESRTRHGNLGKTTAIQQKNNDANVATDAAAKQNTAHEKTTAVAVKKQKSADDKAAKEIAKKQKADDKAAQDVAEKQKKAEAAKAAKEAAEKKKADVEKIAKQAADKQRKAEAERAAKEAADKKKKADAEKAAQAAVEKQKQVEAAKAAKEATEQKKKAEAEKAAKAAAEAKKKANAEKAAKEAVQKQKKAEAERKAAEEASRKKAEADRKAAEEAAKRKAAEEAAQRSKQQGQ